MTTPLSRTDVPVLTALSILARLKVSGGAGSLSPDIGDQFLISLVPSTSTFFSRTTDGINNTDIAYTSTPGTVTIGSLTAVPEPRSLTALAAGAVNAFGCGLLRRARRPRSARSP